MASDFPAFVAKNHDEYDVGQFTLDSANGGKAGSFCFLNLSDNEVEECGADPALILGLMTGNYASRLIYASSKVPVIVLDPNVILGMCSATVPTDAHLTRKYGIAKLASGNWAVDVGDTTNLRVEVFGYDAAKGLFYVKVLANYLQADAIES